jgi:threonine dehydrogenase-like Zn-dependent dehydrogenase
MTAIHGLERCPVSWGDSVVVQGTGPVGLAAIAVARQSGAGKIIAIGGPAHRIAMAQNFGADVVIDIAETTTPEARRELVLAHTGGFGADLVIECVGYPAAVYEGVELPRDGGKYLVLGQYANAGNISFNPHIITRKQLTIHGSWAFEARHVDKALRLLEISHWQRLFAEEITARYPIKEANAALETVRNWRAGKTVLVP